MKLIPFLVLISSMNAQVVGQLTPLNASKKESVVQIITPSGAKPIVVRLVDLDVKSPSGHRWNGAILVFYDQNSGLYLWQHHFLSTRGNIGSGNTTVLDPNLILRKSKVFVSTNQMVFFSYHGITASSEKANSLGDAERLSLLSATSKLQSGELALMTAFRKPFNSGLLRDFTIGAYEAWAIDPSVVDVQSKNSQWLVTVQGLWKEIVTLDANFQHVSHTPAPGETPKYWSTR